MSLPGLRDGPGFIHDLAALSEADRNAVLGLIQVLGEALQGEAPRTLEALRAFADESGRFSRSLPDGGAVSFRLEERGEEGTVIWAESARAGA